MFLILPTPPTVVGVAYAMTSVNRLQRRSLHRHAVAAARPFVNMCMDVATFDLHFWSESDEEVDCSPDLFD